MIGTRKVDRRKTSLIPLSIQRQFLTQRQQEDAQDCYGADLIQREGLGCLYEDQCYIDNRPQLFHNDPWSIQRTPFANFVATLGAMNIDTLVYASAVILLVPNDHCIENSLATPPMVSINAAIADTV